MAENQIPKPQSDDKPVIDPPKPGYDVLAGDPDEPVTDPPKPGYDADSE